MGANEGGADARAPARLRPAPYLVAVAAVGIAWAIHWALEPFIGAYFPLSLFVLAVVVSSWSGGVGPGLFATLLGLAVAYAISPAPGQTLAVTDANHAARLAFFTAAGVAVSVLSELRRTARARAEASAETVASEIRARQQAEERYRRIVEAAMEGVWEVDAGGRTIYANRRLEEMLGYGPGEMIGVPALDLVAPGSIEMARAQWKARTEGRAPETPNECELVRKDGSTLWVQVTASPVMDAAGAFIGNCALLTDTTATRAADRTLRAAERRRATELEVVRALAQAKSLDDAYPRVLELLGVGLGWDLAALWLVDAEKSLLRCAATWRRDDVAPELASHDARATIAPGVDLPGRVWISGEPAWIADVSADADFHRPARESGLVTGFGFPVLSGAACIGVLELFSRRRRDPDPELIAGVGSLGSQVGHFVQARQAEQERATLLAREKQARQEAEAANRAKDEFLATLSHEMRTPLNAIVGWAHLLRTGQLDDAGSRRAVEVIDRNARAQSQIIADVLDVSKIVMGKLTLNVAPVPVVPVVEGALEAIRPAADAKGVRIETAFEPREAFVSGDPDRLRQVVWNLLSNAVKFTPHGGRALVQVRRTGAEVEIRVEDDGAGIDREFLPHVFERFRQSDQSSTRRHGGLGLGLSLVRHLVELHGGSVTVASDGTDRGAAFLVRLPVAQPPGEVAPADAPAAALPAEPSTTAAASGLPPAEGDPPAAAPPRRPES